MASYVDSYGFFAVISALSLICGIIVVITAVMLMARPQEHLIWSSLIIAFSAVSFVGMGGFYIGAILGIIGGAIALSYKPRT
jgi:hypothetical protein